MKHDSNLLFHAYILPSSGCQKDEPWGIVKIKEGRLKHAWHSFLLTTGALLA